VQPPAPQTQPVGQQQSPPHAPPATPAQLLRACIHARQKFTAAIHGFAMLHADHLSRAWQACGPIPEQHPFLHTVEAAGQLQLRVTMAAD
jgi:hypothetical protein